jgi:hypothetical protein
MNFITILIIWLTGCLIAGLLWGVKNASFYVGVILFAALFLSPLLLVIVIIIKIVSPNLLKDKEKKQ